MADEKVEQVVPDDDERLTYDQVARIFDKIAKERGEWVGYPMPVDGLELRIERRNPHREAFQGFALRRNANGELLPSMRVCTNTDVDEDPPVEVNRWFSHRL